MPRTDAAYLGSMLDAARKIAIRTPDVSRETFDGDEDRQIVFTHLIQIIGEAAARVSAETRSAHPEVPWKQIVGMRNKVVHDYLHIDLDVVWDTVQNGIPELIPLLEPLAPADDE